MIPDTDDVGDVGDKQHALILRTLLNRNNDWVNLLFCNYEG